MKKDYAPASQEESLQISRESHDYYAQRARRWRNRVGLGVLGVILFFWVYTLFVTPFFTIQFTKIVGLNKIQPEEIQNRVNDFLNKRRWGIIPRGNLFLLQTDQLAAYFQNDARIASINLQKNYPERSLTVTIEERVPLYIVSLPDRAFAIDKEGIALIPLSIPVPQDTLPVIFDKRLRDTSLGKKIITDQEIQLLQLLQEEVSRFTPLASIIIGEPSGDAATVATKEGWSLYLSLKDSSSAQFERLKVLLNTKIKPEKRKKLEYIDLRFGERVYYK